MESDQATEIFKAHYEKWLKDPKRMKSGYDYEKSYAEMMQKVERDVLQSSVGDRLKSKNTKKNSKRVSEK
jgi:hypothetical protein